MSTQDPYSSPQSDQQPGHRPMESQQQHDQPYAGQGAPSYTAPQQPGPYGGQQGGPGHPGQYEHQQQGQPYGGYAGQGSPGYPGQQQPSGPYGHPQQGYQNAPVRAGNQPGVPIGFVDAIKRFYSKYTQFSGRASRSEYWWVALYLGAVYLVLSMMASLGTDAFGNPSGPGLLATVLLVIFALGNLVPSIALGVRRLHDVNMSGWFYLLGLIPYVGGLVLVVFMVLPPKPEGARFDR